MELSRLEYCDLRDVWRNESSGFSTWLSKTGNLKLLGESIGLDLKFVSREASKSSRFRIDILAKDNTSGEFVIIENQLEETDHSHLGQVVTYASIFESKFIVWIVKDIRPEHEYAINWLNMNTKDPISLYLVRISLVKIGGSNFAPLFTIISKPLKAEFPKIKIILEKEIDHDLFRREDLFSEILNERIVVFFDKTIELGKKYSKIVNTKYSKSLMHLLRDYDSNLFKFYNTREFKKDLFKWADYKGYVVNQEKFIKTGSRLYKSGGIEYIIVTKDDA